ncbi:MAG: M15 family metallopeptidase [bacterium]|nr:M15 family metallopeptidase [bacterium]
MNRSKLIQMFLLLTVIAVAAGGFLRIAQSNSMTLTEYERLNMASGESDSSSRDGSPETSGQTEDENPNGNLTPAGGSPEDPTASGQAEKENPNGSLTPAEGSPNDSLSPLIGASLNGGSQADSRITYEEGFYFEPISDSLRRYITGISYPSPDSAEPEITVDELRYVHILHYSFDGDSTEGELICNEYIAQDLVEIFYELYRNEYRLERVLLIDEYDGDDTASMADNNTSCFNYRVIEGKTSLSKHAYGLAVDINPLYNPYITYGKDGDENISPAAAAPYADRTAGFPYKIDESDLCYRLFTEHGFTWGGNWNNSKDYQHFQKAKP